VGAHPLGGWWTPGEAGALVAAERFAAEALGTYPEDRDRPDLIGTSRLSPHLAFGEISPKQLLASLSRQSDPAAAAFVRQLYWREFAHHTLHHFPDSTERPLQPAFEHFGWAEDPDGFAAWRAGRTGYPLVDAGMRELAATGWMHNRVRMVVASFLTKDLLLPWQDGARHFWEHLADADLANNTFGWQWVAGSGADAAPYFRVFNPVLQGQKFDPHGAYVRAWVPEIAALPDRWIHRPWEAPREVLAQAAVVLGRTYPEPIVDHAWARQRALATYEAIKSGRG
jgi:deoxyribodipyrimidine photo-lyase